jgi:hydroxymethylpyrimidine/phosphomethylpyrimidine kinase
MTRPCVLVFAGADPSGGAGIQADIQAIAALGAHPLSVITALTVQDNDRVHSIHPVPALLVQQQARALMNKIDISAIKIGIVGNRANAEAIAEIVKELRLRQPDLPVVLDPVLASGHGDALAAENALHAIEPLLALASLITPNLPEAAALCGGNRRADSQAEVLLQRGCKHVLIKGGHGTDVIVVNRWFTEGDSRSWTWPRLPGAFHGTGCTLASASAAMLAGGNDMVESIDVAQAYCHQTLLSSYAIADGQRIPNRAVSFFKEST